jgi:putative acyl-CoA dehydrogenase
MSSWRARRPKQSRALLQGAELLRHSTPEVIDVFMKTRLGGGMNSLGGDVPRWGPA